MAFWESTSSPSSEVNSAASPSAECTASGIKIALLFNSGPYTSYTWHPSMTLSTQHCSPASSSSCNGTEPDGAINIICRTETRYLARGAVTNKAPGSAGPECRTFWTPFIGLYPPKDMSSRAMVIDSPFLSHSPYTRKAANRMVFF